MRYPYYRYQFGGATPEKQSNSDNQPITNSNKRKYESNHWSKGWIIHNDTLAAPVGDKNTFIEKRIKILRKKTQKKKEEEKLSSVSVQKSQGKKRKGLGNIMREGILQGTKAYDTFRRSMQKGSDYMFGRRKPGRSSSRRRTTRKSKKTNTKTLLNHEIKMKQLEIEEKKLAKTHQSPTAVEQHNFCVTDEDCNPGQACYYNFVQRQRFGICGTILNPQQIETKIDELQKQRADRKSAEMENLALREKVEAQIRRSESAHIAAGRGTEPYDAVHRRDSYDAGLYMPPWQPPAALQESSLYDDQGPFSHGDESDWDASGTSSFDESSSAGLNDTAPWNRSFGLRQDEPM